MTHPLRQYSTYKPGLFGDETPEALRGFCARFGFEGLEAFMDDIKSRDKVLFADAEERRLLGDRLSSLSVKRLHCSYWAYPTSFLAKNDFAELVERFGGEKNVSGYYGDLTGDHIFARWAQEYELARDLGAQAYVFHLIDYAPIDGRWNFSISKHDIRQAMVFMTQQFLNILADRGLLDAGSPVIELENAGWGLEHGVQTAEDYQLLFSQVHDPLCKLRISWDCNHLLHALGYDESASSARFFLPPEEVGEGMRELEREYGGTPSVMAQKWLEYNILDSRIVGRTGCLQLSDCKPNAIEYFVNGKLSGTYFTELAALKSWDEQENYGVDIVLSAYDSHVAIGDGVLVPENVRILVAAVRKAAPEAVVLHELKNSPDQEAAIGRQTAALRLS